MLGEAECLFGDFSRQQLIDKLKETLFELQEREQDLNIAAQLGAKLVQENAQLAHEKEQWLMQGPPSKENSIVEEQDESLVDSFSQSMSMQEPIKEGEMVLKRKQSVAIFDQISHLEKENALLKHQVEEGALSKKDMDMASARTIASLRKANAKLQNELKTTLLSLRDHEKDHSKVVQKLERHVEGLKRELEASSRRVEVAEAERDKMLQEKIETMKEMNDLEMSDSHVISHLNKINSELENENGKLRQRVKDQESTSRQLVHQVNVLQEHVIEMQSQLEPLLNMKQHYDEQVELVEYLKQALEMEREKNMEYQADTELQEEEHPQAIVQNAGTTLSKSPSGQWEWSSWMDRSWNKIWERDISGLQNEIVDLRENQTQAIQRMKDQLEGLVGSAVDRIVPTPVKNITSIIASGGDPVASYLTPHGATLAVRNAEAIQ